MTKETALALNESKSDEVLNEENTASVFGRYWPEFATLTNLQKAVLIRLINNIASEEVQTDAEISRELGIHRHSIQHCRNHPVFIRLLANITVDVVRGNIDSVITDAFRASHDGKVSAMELLMKYSGEYIPQSQQSILHSKADAGQIRTPADALGKICKQFKMIGFTKERFIDEFSEIWDKLAEEGGF